MCTGSSSTPLRAWDSWEDEEYFFFMKGMKLRGSLIDFGLLYGNSIVKWEVLELVGEGTSMGMTAMGFYFLGFRFILMVVVGMSPLSLIPGEA